jgi:phosphohistidine phosphatase
MGKGAACGFAGTLPGPMELVWHLPRRILERLAANDGG